MFQKIKKISILGIKKQAIIDKILTVIIVILFGYLFSRVEITFVTFLLLFQGNNMSLIIVKKSIFFKSKEKNGIAIK